MPTVENDIEFEREKLRINAELEKERFRQNVLKVVYGTMIVGLAAAFFPFAQKFAEFVFTERIESIRKDAAIETLKEKNRLEEQLEDAKHALKAKEQSLRQRNVHREYLETLASEARSERIEKRIIIAEFFSFLEGDEPQRKQWEKFRDYLYALQKRLNNETIGLIQTTRDPNLTSVARATAQRRLDQIERLENPRERDLRPKYDLPMPPPGPGQTRLGRDMLRVALTELNSGVHEQSQSDRVAEYWAATGYDWRGDREVGWNAAFISWLFSKTGNPHQLELTPTNAIVWNSARQKNLTFRPGVDDVKPAPGDLVFLASAGSLSRLDQIRSGPLKLFPTYMGIIYFVDDSNLIGMISGDHRDAVRLTTVEQDSGRVIGYIRLTDKTPSQPQAGRQ